MSKLWQKDDSKLHTLIEKYTVGEDYILDQDILPYDIDASIAHAKGLARIGILTAVEVGELEKALKDLKVLALKGEVTINVEDEDCHTVIENYLTDKLGEVGKKIHTGRSRNDQVLVAVRLYLKAELGETIMAVKDLAELLLAKAQEYENVPFPGYSHTQQAMLINLGHYYLSFVESLIDDVSFAKAAAGHLDKNPLGSAAGFGVNLDLDRDFTAQELGFESVQLNSLYCQSSRGKFESIYLESLVQIMLTLGKLASDLLMYTTREFGFFTATSAITTGSSIMPQKKNFDALEVMRANVAVVLSQQQLVQTIVKGLGSGYHRDLQLLKKALITATVTTKESIAVATVIISDIKPNEEGIKAKIQTDIIAADLAVELVKQEGIAFRDAYKKAMDGLPSGEVDYEKFISEKLSPGGPGNLQIEHYQARLKLL